MTSDACVRTSGRSTERVRFIAVAEVRVTSSAACLKDICLHFAPRKIESLQDSHGTISFDFGTCLLEARDSVLLLQANSSTESGLGHVQRVIASHLGRLSYGDNLFVAWHRITPRWL